MRYQAFGKTGFEISKLGFGAMRMPEKEVDGKMTLDIEASVDLMRRSFELGVNYVDTAYIYHDGLSEVAVGQAIKGVRDQVRLSSKSPGHLVKKAGDYRRILEEQLTRLQEDSIDFYHFHGIGYQGFLDIDKRSGWLKDAQKAKEEGLIKNISFSFHSAPEDLIKLVDLGLFSSVLCQYNLIDRSNEAGMAYAKSKGLGVVIMGPVGGGRIAGLPDHLRQEIGLSVENNVEMALRFVTANSNVDCVLSGMGSLEMLEQNARYTSNAAPLSSQEVEAVNALMQKLRKLADLYCTGCKYCLPCPAGIQIPFIFDLYNCHEVYKFHDHARWNYANMGKMDWLPKVKADACTECGECEKRCPQKIQIREQLKAAHKLLR